MPTHWALQRWDLRAWCTPDAVFARVCASLLKATDLQQGSLMVPLTDRPGRTARRQDIKVATPGLELKNASEAAMKEDLSCDVAYWDIVNPPDRETSVSALLGELADALDSGGTSHFDLKTNVSKYQLESLVRVGAIRSSQNEFDETTYVLEPCGVRFEPWLTYGASAYPPTPAKMKNVKTTVTQ